MKLKRQLLTLDLNIRSRYFEKDIIKNIEVFKKIVTGDELSVEEKFKNTRIIKPYCKFIWGTNNLPQLN